MQGDSVQMKSTTEHRLETCIHSDTCLPGYSIDHNLVIPRPILTPWSLDTYLLYSQPCNALPIDKKFNEQYISNNSLPRHIFYDGILFLQ